MKKLFLAFIAVYFLTFCFISGEVHVADVAYSLPTVFIDPLDAALAALGTFNVSKTIRKRGLGDQPKDRV
jgi:hypothetical protein